MNHEFSINTIKTNKTNASTSLSNFAANRTSSIEKINLKEIKESKEDKPLGKRPKIPLFCKEIYFEGEPVIEKELNYFSDARSQTSIEAVESLWKKENLDLKNRFPEIYLYPRLTKHRPDEYKKKKEELVQMKNSIERQMIMEKMRKVDSIKMMKIEGMEKITRHKEEKMSQVKSVRAKKKELMIELEEQKQRVEDILKQRRERIEKVKKRKEKLKRQRDQVKVFNCQSNMIDRQLRIKEAKIKAIEIQENIIKEVHKRREVNHFRKEKLAYLANAIEH